MDSGLRSFVSVQGSLAMFAIWAFGSEEQKREWLPRMAAGRAVGCFGLTEPDSGSDPASMRTHAKRDGSDWILNGTKLWITNGGIADVAIVWASTDAGVQGFLVPTGTQGFTANDIPRKMSLRASITSELVLDQCRIPASAALPTGTGLGAPLECLNEARYGIAWGTVGSARSCLLEALDYAKNRSQFGAPVAAYQLTQQKLVEMALTVSRMSLMAFQLSSLKESGALHHTHVSMAKFANTRDALRVARTARTILGANGITLDYGALRHTMNLESVLTYEGTEEIHTLIIGEALTGHSAFRVDERVSR